MTEINLLEIKHKVRCFVWKYANNNISNIYYVLNMFSIGLFYVNVKQAQSNSTCTANCKSIVTFMHFIYPLSTPVTDTYMCSYTFFQLFLAHCLSS